MKRVLFVTKYASPYRVHFFKELAKECDLTVLYTDGVKGGAHRDAQWFEEGENGFRTILLHRDLTIKGMALCTEVLRYMTRDYDEILICGYSSPTNILAMLGLRLRRIPFWMEVDGGLIRQENKIKFLIKRFLVRLAPKWLSTGKQTSRFLIHYGAEAPKIREYPFSSQYREEILTEPVSPDEKKALREKLGIPEEQMILSIGQFIHRKGFDVLLRSAAQLDGDAGIYIIGGEETEEYRALCRELGLDKVHFLGFMKKEQLSDYFRAADLFVLPTREDIWGLVINEAMGYGLPVVTTDRCVAGMELVEEGISGHIVPTDDPQALAEAIRDILDGSCRELGENALEKVRGYCFETMVQAHLAAFQEKPL